MLGDDHDTILHDGWLKESWNKPVANKHLQDNLTGVGEDGVTSQILF